MPDPSLLSRRIDALPDTFCRLKSDPTVSESLARADESKRRLAGLLPLDGVEQSAIDEYHRDWLARYVYNSNAIEGSTLSLKDTELVLEGGFLPARAPARYILAARGVADGMAYVKTVRRPEASAGHRHHPQAPRDHRSGRAARLARRVPPVRVSRPYPRGRGEDGRPV